MALELLTFRSAGYEILGSYNFLTYTDKDNQLVFKLADTNIFVFFDFKNDPKLPADVKVLRYPATMIAGVEGEAVSFSICFQNLTNVIGVSSNDPIDLGEYGETHIFMRFRASKPNPSGAFYEILITFYRPLKQPWLNSSLTKTLGPAE